MVVVVTVGGGYREIIQKGGKGRVRKKEKKIYVWDKFRCVCLVLKKKIAGYSPKGEDKNIAIKVKTGSVGVCCRCGSQCVTLIIIVVSFFR